MKLCSFLQKLQNHGLRMFYKAKAWDSNHLNEYKLMHWISRHTRTHTHPFRNKNLRSKKAVHWKKDMSIHSISVTEVLERPLFTTNGFPRHFFSSLGMPTFFGEQPSLHSFHLILCAKSYLMVQKHKRKFRWNHEKVPIMSRWTATSSILSIWKCVD